MAIDMKKRYLQNLILEDAIKSKKMSFISGPRQVGKTTLMKSLLNEFDAALNYYNWDDDDFKLSWLKHPKELIRGKKIIALDEIHKDVRWKNKLKGLYDLFNEQTAFIISGSARLDYYRKSGDSMQGRYLPFRLHPFTAGESDIVKSPPNMAWDEEAGKTLYDSSDLLALSGFPEPFCAQKKEKAMRWKRLYQERLIQEDLRDFVNVREIGQLKNLMLLLSARIGSTLSYESLRQDLSCSFESILRWIDSFEAMFCCYRVRPYSKDVKYSIKKEPKLFFYDWTVPRNEGAQFENFIAGHLLKNVHLWTDAAFGNFELYYLRDKQKREVDFFVTKNEKPYLLVEVKSNQSVPTPALQYFNNMLRPNFCLQLVKEKKKEVRQSLQNKNIQIISLDRFLAALN